MISVLNAESALRSTCLGIFSNQVNNSTNPVLTMAAKNTVNVTGKRVKQAIKHVNNAAAALTELADVPDAANAKYSLIDVPLKNIYGTLQISDKALRVSLADTNMFANLLQEEMEYLIRASQNVLNTMIYGNGAGCDVNGIESIFREDCIYNLNTNDVKDLLPFVYSEANAAKQTKFTEKQLYDGLEGFELQTGAMPDIIVGNGDFKAHLSADMKLYRPHVDIVDLSGGFKAINFGGIPFYSDEKCLPNNLYFLNANSFSMYQMGDWQWMQGDDARILKQLAGKSVFAATLAKYCDFICRKPFENGKMKNYSLTSV